MKKNEYLIYGYASIFDYYDSSRDIILKACFEKTVNFHQKQNYENIPLLWQHNSSFPIGKVSRLKIDDYGLYIVAKLDDVTAKSFEAIHFIYSKIINSFSVGIKIIKYQDLKKGRQITEADLMEVSLVTFPSNKRAKLQKIQHLKDGKVKYLSRSNLENSILKAESIIEKMYLDKK